MRRSQVADLGAGAASAIGQPEQGAHFLEREAQVSRPAYERKALELDHAETPKASFRPGGPAEQADPLVVADRLDVAAGLLRELANGNVGSKIVHRLPHGAVMR
jgi:hypothetical protein